MAKDFDILACRMCFQVLHTLYLPFSSFLPLSNPPLFHFSQVKTTLVEVLENDQISKIQESVIFDLFP